MHRYSFSLIRVNNRFTRSSRFLACFVAVVGGANGVLMAQAQSGDAPRLSLERAVATALEQNLGLAVDRYDPAIAAENIIAAEAGFDLEAYADLSYDQGSQDAQNTTSDQRSYRAGVRKLIRTGATVSASTGLQRNDRMGSYVNNEGITVTGGQLRETASVSLSVTQPLLRGFGTQVTLAELRGARLANEAARLRLRAGVLDLLVDVEQSYWQVADADARLQFRQSNLELAHRLLDEVRERNSLGLATDLEVLQSEANLAQREQDILTAERLVSERTDALFAVLGGLDDDAAINANVNVAPIPDLAKDLPPFDSVWSGALRNSLETAAQEAVIEQRSLDTIVAKNATRPQLDLTLSAAYSGISDDTNASGADAYERAFDREGEDWGVALSFNYPFGSRANYARQRQAVYRQRQAEGELAVLKQNLLRDTRAAWRNLQVARKQVNAAETTVRLQEATFEQERGRYEEGLSTIRDVLEIQTDLDNARTALLDAQYEAIIAEVRLERLEGTLLERHGLTWPAIAIDAGPENATNP